MKVLVVEDDSINLEILVKYLSDDGYDVITAIDGAMGWQTLRKHRDISVALLDKMMPNVNGMELLNRMKSDPRLKNIPVIMQTAAADDMSVIEGINSGVYYYLAKPYTKNILISIVRSAIESAKYLNEIISEVRNNQCTLGLLKTATFEYRTVAEAKNLALFLANSFPEPEKVVLGLSEVMVNAVEHGNLDIGYYEKGRLMSLGKLADEIAKRLKLAENTTKTVEVNFTKEFNEINVTVKDKGKGFDWRSFLEMRPDRASAPNGRGILMAKMMSFDSLTYNEAGNVAQCKVIHGDAV